jgi:hypothetical protein
MDSEHYKYAASAHQMLGWPTIQQLLETVQPKVPSLDLSSVEQTRPTIMLSLRKSANQGLPADTDCPISGMSWNSVQRLSTAYFETFNLLHPILDRHSFMSETMPSVFRDGFSQSTASTVTLLVLALGETALSASDGHPAHSQHGRLSGVKGGSKDRPPGLELFNEARRRMGFHLTACSIENAQMFILARYGPLLKA